MELSGTINEGIVVFDEPCPVSNGAKVVVRIDERPNENLADPVGQRLLRKIGTVNGLPDDLAMQHDHSLHGVPKK